MQNYKIKISGLILDSEKNLLIFKNKNKSIWTCPGGKIEEGESELECLKRELFEEAGIKLIEAEHFIDTEIEPAAGDPNLFVVMKFYLVKSYSGKVGVNENDSVEIQKWISRIEYDSGKYELGSGLTKYAIPKLIEEELF